MKVYVWEGVNAQGVRQRGEMEAVNENVVRNILKRQNINPTLIKEKRKSILESIPFLSPSVSGKDLVLFTRQFATLINSGIPIVQALDVMANQIENRYFASIIRQIKADVEGGATLADSIKKHPKIFDRLYTNMVAAGEAGGILDNVLQRLSAYLEKAQKLKRKVIGSLTYPAIVLAISFIVVAIILVFVIPTFAAMFAEANMPLPGPTLLVIKISDFLKTYSIVIIGIFFLIGFIIKRIYETEKGRLAIDRFLLNAPLVGGLLRKVAVARFARTMGTLITSGVSIIETLTIAAGTAGNKVIENVMYEIRKSVAEGKTIAQPLHESGVFPPMVVSMVAIGEATGALDAMLAKVADFYEEEVDAAVDALTSAIEPIMIVFLGGTIGSILIAMYLPIFSMAAAIK